jgi:cytidyltransferase-like protein
MDIPDNQSKKVFVSGCFDLIHSGHIEFFKQAAEYGDLYVSVGSDATIKELKGKEPVFKQEERLYIVQAIKYVRDAFIGSGRGKLDFIRELIKINPEIFIVNEDGDSPEKKELCRALGIQYLVLKRIPKEGLPIRSSTDLKKEILMPYRIDLAGGWLDQPFVSKHHPGPVITISIHPSNEFDLRSGMATSTRSKAIELWGHNLPASDEKTAKILFAYENPPGKTEISGSQDSIGIVLPGLNYLHYNGKYWPEKMQTIEDEEILSWLESKIHLIPLGPRKDGYDVLGINFVNPENAKRLAEAAERCFNAILLKDIKLFGESFKESFEAQIRMFPNMINKDVESLIEKYKHLAYGWKLSGAGGGGYLILVSENPIENSIKIKIRRK